MGKQCCNRIIALLSTTRPGRSLSCKMSPTLLLCLQFQIFCVSCFTMDDLVVDSSWKETRPENGLRSLSFVNEELAEFEDGMMTRLMPTSEESAEERPDCFGLTPILGKAFKWLFRPQSKEKIDTKFYLSTRLNRSAMLVNLEDDSRKLFDKHKKTVLIVHGFMSNSLMFWVREMVGAILDKEDVNVIAVDWAGGSMSWKYWRAVGNTRVVGKQTARFLKSLGHVGTNTKNLHCIGHSLGAHICSFIANKLGKLGRITGLDPAEPCFTQAGLNSSDAYFVDIVHTNVKLLGKFGLGIPHPMGSVDFYPNGGTLQPGCILRDSSFLTSWLPINRKALEGAICSHGRSYQYFIDALRTENCHFWGRKWDLSHNGALKSLKESCNLKNCVPLGLDANSYPGKGSFFLPTYDTSPYCIKDKETEKSMHWLYQTFVRKFWSG